MSTVDRRTGSASKFAYWMRQEFATTANPVYVFEMATDSGGARTFVRSRVSLPLEFALADKGVLCEKGFAHENCMSGLCGEEGGHWGGYAETQQAAMDNAAYEALLMLDAYRTN